MNIPKNVYAFNIIGEYIYGTNIMKKTANDKKRHFL